VPAGQHRPRLISRSARRDWTLLRGRAVERDDAACPACAAPLGLTAAGDRERCGAHLTTAAFDWVLARIEHDDAYRG
jgi:hypothetical protein